PASPGHARRGIGNGNRRASTGPDPVELLTLPQGDTVEFKQDAPGAPAHGDRALLPAVRLPARQRPGRRESQDGAVEFEAEAHRSAADRGLPLLDTPGTAATGPAPDASPRDGDAGYWPLIRMSSEDGKGDMGTRLIVCSATRGPMPIRARKSMMGANIARSMLSCWMRWSRASRLP